MAERERVYRREQMNDTLKRELTNQEIVESAVAKSIKRGFNLIGINHWYINGKNCLIIRRRVGAGSYEETLSLPDLIADEGFMKALSYPLPIGWYI
jgi:hypothetical protein